MSKRKRHVEVVLYMEDGWTYEKIVALMESKRSVKEFAAMLHDQDVNGDGTPKKPHFHIYINFGGSAPEFKYIAAWFNIPESRVQKIKTNKPTVLCYYTHENEPYKHQYPLEDMVANFDVAAYLKEHEQKASVSKVIQQCADGTITPLNYTEHISGSIYAANERKIQSAWKYASDLRSIASQGTCERTIIWLHGATMVGKGELCKMVARSRNLPLYFTSTGKDPFGEYRNEPIAVLDDLRPYEPFTFAELLKITDPHNLCSVKSRYRNKELVCPLIFITSPLSPVEFASRYNLENESAAQLYRRLAEVWHVTQPAINISKYNVDMGVFVNTSLRPNPVPAYLATLAPALPAIDGDEVLGQLYRTYVPTPGYIPEQQTLFPNDEAATPESVDTNTPPNYEKEVLPF